jgi:hypothetical protein
LVSKGICLRKYRVEGVGGVENGVCVSEAANCFVSAEKVKPLNPSFSDGKR